MFARIKHYKTIFTYLLMFVISILSIYFICFFIANGSVTKENVKTLDKYTDQWELRLGDSPLNPDGTPQWSTDNGHAGWTKINYGKNLAQTHSYKYVWLRATLKASHLVSPCILFLSRDYDSEIFIDGKLIYKHGEFNPSVKNFKFGSNWNIVELPPNYSGKTIYFRSYVPFPSSLGHDIKGFFGTKDNIVDAKNHEMVSLLTNEIDFIVLSFLYIFIGLVILFIFLMRQRKQAEFFSLGFFSIMMGLWIITDREFIQYFFDNRVVLNDLAVIFIQLVPIGFASFVEKIFGGKMKFILRRLWQFLIIYSIVMFILNYTKIFTYFNSLKYFFICLLISMLLILYAIIREAMNGNNEARIICFGISVLCITGVYDILQMFYFKTLQSLMGLMGHHLSQWGMFVFLLCLVYILGQRFVKVYQQLRIYSIEIEEKNRTLSQMWEEVKQSRDTIALWNKELERTVATRTASIKNLLNNAGQGFLSFGSDLIVNDEYSSECLNIFGGRIENSRFPDLLFPDNEEQRIFLEKIMIKIFSSQDDSRREIYIPLIPDEVEVGYKKINISYKVIRNIEDENSETIMAILTDITEKRALESQMEREKNILKMVVKVVVNYSDFCDSVHDYQNFFQNKLPNILKSKSEFEIVFFEVFRNIHTFKGTFGQFDMLNTVKFLHDLESQMAEMRLDFSKVSLDDFKSFINTINAFESIIEDMDILKNILGEDFFNQKNVFTIEKSKLLEIEKKALSVLSPFECKMLIPDLKKLMYKPFKEGLKIYPEYIMKISERLDKLINPLFIEGGDMLVDAELYNEFAKSLVHIFRNMLDHGIESVDERYNAGKDEFGTIKCKTELIDDNIIVSISDDGRGMNFDGIRQKAIEKGIFDESAAENLTEEQLIELTFTDEFSTTEIVTELSGRGIGLSAVKSEVELLGGRIEVESKTGEGTLFRFILPYESAQESIETSIQDIMNPLISSTSDFINNNLNENVLSNDSFNINKDDTLPLSKYSTIINIKGIIEANFVMTYDENLAKNIASDYLPDNSDDPENYIIEAISEASNIILGNSIRMFHGIENMIMISSPLSVYSNEALIKYQGLDVWTCNMRFKSGSVTLSFLLSDNLLNPIKK